MRGWVASPCFRRCSRFLCAPRRAAAMTDGKWFEQFVDVLVPATRRYRWLLVSAAVLVMLCGAASLFGIPGRLAPLQLETDALTYVNPREPVAQDTRQFVQANGLDIQDLWLQTQPGRALDPDVPAQRVPADAAARTASRDQCGRTARPRCCAGRVISKPAPISCPPRPKRGRSSPRIWSRSS